MKNRVVQPTPSAYLETVGDSLSEDSILRKHARKSKVPLFTKGEVIRVIDRIEPLQSRLFVSGQDVWVSQFKGKIHSLGTGPC